MFIVPVSRRAAVRSHHFDSLLDTAFDQLFAQPAADYRAGAPPRHRRSESDAGYVVTLDVPGVPRGREGVHRRPPREHRRRSAPA